MPRGRKTTSEQNDERTAPGRGKYYMISVVAKSYGIHPQTLRLYEREGLLKPSRTEGNTRLYSEEDLRQLEVILNLTRDLGVNLAGVEIILNLLEQINLMQIELEQLRHRFHRRRPAHDHDVGKGRHEAHGLQLLRGIERDGLEEVRADRERRGADQQRVAVRLRARHHLGAQQRSGAVAVLHDHRPPELAGEPLGEKPREDVGRSPGGARRHDRDRARGIAFRGEGVGGDECE